MGDVEELKQNATHCWARKKPRKFKKIRIRMRHWLKIPDFRVLLTDLKINTKFSPLFTASSGKKKFIFASCYTDALSVPSVCLEEKNRNTIRPTPRMRLALCDIRRG